MNVKFVLVIIAIILAIPMVADGVLADDAEKQEESPGDIDPRESFIFARQFPT